MADHSYSNRVQKPFDNYHKKLSRDGQAHGRSFQPGFQDIGIGIGMDMYRGNDFMMMKQIKIEVDERNKKYFEVNDDLNNDW